MTVRDNFDIPNRQRDTLEGGISDLTCMKSKGFHTNRRIC